MKNSFILAVLITFFITGCSEKVVYVPVQPNSNGKGSIQLKIDNQNRPENVMEVIAYLSRTGYDTLSASLNLVTDSTAELTMNDIDAGSWHLQVDALDSASVVVYTGQTDVSILADVTTNVYLTLNPTGNGKGNIFIHVTWGVPQNTNWVDYSNNPILTPQNNYWDFNGVAECKILLDNGVFKMWYLGLVNSGVANVGYAESTDGISWSRPFSNPVLSPGNYGAWDASSVGPGAIIKENGEYKMYYVGWADQNSNWDIGLATSTDGINWTKYAGNPILYGTSGWEYQIIPAAIIKINDTYYLYYYGRNLPEYRIGLATSTDGINWERYNGNPILSPTKPWEGTGVLHPSIINENGIFKMVYGNSTASGFGVATSTDGINWTKSDGNPFFTKNDTHNDWASYKVAYPFFMKTDSEYRVYYSGLNYPNSPLRIGYTKKSF
jgi:predicted GH43/DUF377 family glycosyl hydrolase